MNKGIFISICLMFCSGAFADNSEGEKHYVMPENVFVKQNGIFVDIGGCMYQAKGLSKDGQGIFAIMDGVWMVHCSKCNEDYDLDNQSSKCPHGLLVRN